MTDTDNDNQDFTQKTLVEEFKKLNITINHVGTKNVVDVNALKILQEIQSNMLSTYEKVEKMHADVRIKEANVNLQKEILKPRPRSNLGFSDI